MVFPPQNCVIRPLCEILIPAKIAVVSGKACSLWRALAMICRLTVILTGVALFGCATGQPEQLRQFRSAEVFDSRVQAEVDDELRTILKVTEHSDRANFYRVYLIRGLRQKGIAGFSLGEAEPGRRVVLLDYELAQKGVDGGLGSFDRWQLRTVLTHEVGHGVAGHVANMATVSNALQGVNILGRGMSYVPGPVGWIGAGIAWASFGASYANVYLYGRQAELEADRKAMEYWRKLGWPCGFWVRWFEALQEAEIKGDFRHPTEGRLEQARGTCPAAEVAKVPRIVFRKPEKPPAPAEQQRGATPTGRSPDQ